MGSAAGATDRHNNTPSQSHLSYWFVQGVSGCSGFEPSLWQCPSCLRVEFFEPGAEHLSTPPELRAESHRTDSSSLDYKVMKIFSTLIGSR